MNHKRNSKKKKYTKPAIETFDSVKNITKAVSVGSGDGDMGSFGN